MCEPRFPVDLEREVFETAALMEMREIPTLLRVARRVLIWIEPFLYCWTPPQFFHAIRHLAWWYTSATCSVAELKQLLRLCKGVVDLSCANLSDPTLLPILAEMHLQRLSLALEDIFGDSPDLAHPLFGSITHLDLCDAVDSLALNLAYAQIPALPALTHLAVPFDVPRDIALMLLEQCPRLQLLLLLWPRSCADLYEQTLVHGVYDVRFVIGLLDDYWKDWEDGAKGL
ncbi:hypothetical protein C8R45DRAFT_998871 [Mycena sanguinolenta]|nr:hypothetical protein C8R45DRAFT_998871 [Mycena sanguinolenta]